MHTYLGNAELFIEQIGNIDAMERFRNDNKHLLQTKFEDWPEEQLHSLTKVSSQFSYFHDPAKNFVKLICRCSAWIYVFTTRISDHSVV
jgi:hypothetical protein